MGVVYRRPIGAVVTVQRVRRRLPMSRLDSTRSLTGSYLESAFVVLAGGVHDEERKATVLRLSVSTSVRLSHIFNVNAVIAVYPPTGERECFDSSICGPVLLFWMPENSEGEYNEADMTKTFALEIPWLRKVVQSLLTTVIQK